MANPRVNISHRRLLATAVLAVVAVSACQGPAESQQTGRAPGGQTAHGAGRQVAAFAARGGRA